MKNLYRHKKNTEEMAKFFGISEEDMLKATLKQPQLLTLPWDTIKERVEKIEDYFGISKNAILTQSLLSSLPETLNKNTEEMANFFGISEEKMVEATLKQRQLFILPWDTIKERVEKIEDYFGISKNAVLTQSLLSSLPETLKKNIEEMAKLFSISEEKMIKAASSYTTLFTQKPETLKKNIEEMAKLLGISEENMLKAALKQPRFFSLPYNIIKERAKEIEELLGISKNDVLKRPALLTRSPEILNKNIKEMAKFLGIPKEKMVKAALKCQRLFTQKPETLKKNIEKTAKLFGISKEKMVEAALKYPQIFPQKPETLKKNFNYIKAVHEKGFINSEDLVRGILKSPVILTVASTNTILRAIYMFTNKLDPQKLTSFFRIKSLTRKQIEEEVVQYYQDKNTEKYNQTLQILTEHGIISNSNLTEAFNEPYNPDNLDQDNKALHIVCSIMKLSIPYVPDRLIDPFCIP